MPTKERYKKITELSDKCPKCGGHKDDKNFITCSICRLDKKNRVIVKNIFKAKKKNSERSELRQSAMSLFGVKK